MSAMPVEVELRSSLSVPEPVMPFTVTSYSVALTAETEFTVPSAVPVFVSVKSSLSTPVTPSLKVTWYVMLLAFVVSKAKASLLMLKTVGATVSQADIVLPVLSVSSALPTVSVIVPDKAEYVTVTPEPAAVPISATVSTT
ncbi:hypothetical protein SDC9_182127 [bioreactor metagenome]|uniref:Uncharacterized protein n=1 Tax=bioreactor metagenome TaxID=1076179 RepID=A0A645HG38_9ZZZZ